MLNMLIHYLKFETVMINVIAGGTAKPNDLQTSVRSNDLMLKIYLKCVSMLEMSLCQTYSSNNLRK